jgi:hypothetical protein
MGNDRYEPRHGSRGEHDRWQDDRSRGRPREERGFFERAGEEIASWFGDDDDRFRDRQPERSHGSRNYREDGAQRSWPGGQRHEQERGRYGERDQDEDRNWFGGRDRQERGSYRSRALSDQNPGESWSANDRSREDRDRRPITGDYSRSQGGRGQGRYQPSGEGFRHPQRPEYDRSESNWDRDDYRRSSFAGSRERSQHHDPHYQQWRERQMQELDRDYHEYHSERQSKFEDDFGSWREKRQQKRQTLGSVREHMDVVGRDGEHVGTVDKVAGDRIILTKSDPAADGVHHSISCNDVDCIENNRILLDCTAEEAKQKWRTEDHSRALFERENQGQDGPHMLDRSFSGTYRD